MHIHEKWLGLCCWMVRTHEFCEPPGTICHCRLTPMVSQTSFHRCLKIFIWIFPKRLKHYRLTCCPLLIKITETNYYTTTVYGSLDIVLDYPGQPVPETHTHTQLFYGSVDFVRDNPSDLVPEDTFTHSHSSWSSITPIHYHKCFTFLSTVVNNNNNKQQQNTFNDPLSSTTQMSRC